MTARHLAGRARCYKESGPAKRFRVVLRPLKGCGEAELEALARDLEALVTATEE